MNNIIKEWPYNSVPQYYAQFTSISLIFGKVVELQDFKYCKQEMSLKKTNGVGLKKEENITQNRLSTCRST